MKPLDLQNLFVRINEVGKQQASKQDASLHAQHVAAQEIEQETRMADKRVAKTEEQGDGPEKMHDDQGRQKGNQTGQRKKTPEEQDEEDQKKKNVFKDPDLGNRIDISG